MIRLHIYMEGQKHPPRVDFILTQQGELIPNPDLVSGQASRRNLIVEGTIDTLTTWQIFHLYSFTQMPTLFEIFWHFDVPEGLLESWKAPPTDTRH